MIAAQDQGERALANGLRGLHRQPAADFRNRRQQVERAVRVFISLFEPALLVFMAALVGFVVIAMLLPVFSLSSMIK